MLQKYLMRGPETEGGGMKTVNHVFEDGGAKAAWFKDTEGNIMALVQVTA